jgi:hypothetical protein
VASELPETLKSHAYAGITRVTEASKANIIFAMYFIILLETYD